MFDPTRYNRLLELRTNDEDWDWAFAVPMYMSPLWYHHHDNMLKAWIMDQDHDPTADELIDYNYKLIAKLESHFPHPEIAEPGSTPALSVDNV